MTMFGWNALQYQYTPVGRVEPRSGRQFYQVLVILLLVVTSFVVGRLSLQTGTTVEADLGIASAERTFVYQRIYGEHPSPESDLVWDAIFPEHGGFFRHPTVAPRRAVFSVFHQLHCLNGIRKGYWALNDMARSGEPFNASALPMEAGESHIRHCIDLLRQVMMCQPDLTVEFKDEARGGVHGFGTERMCYDWEQLMDWTREWQDYEA